MRHKILLTCVAAAMFAGAGAQDLKWTSSFDAALKQAKRTKKLVLVDFYADWCGYCKLMERTTLRDKKVVKAIRANYVPVRVDTERGGRRLAQLYRVNQLPALIIFKPSGQALVQYNGMPTVKHMLSFLKEGLDEARPRT